MRLCRKPQPPIFAEIREMHGTFESTPPTRCEAPNQLLRSAQFQSVASIVRELCSARRSLLRKPGAWGGFRLSAPNTCWTTGSSVTPAVDGMRCTSESGLDVVRLVDVSADPSERVEAVARFPGRRGQLLRRWLAHGLAKLVVLPVRTPPPMHRRVVFPYGKRAHTACNGCAWYTRL